MKSKRICCLPVLALLVLAGQVMAADGRRLAAVAWTKSRRHFERNGTAQTVARRRAAAGLESYGRRTWLLVVFHRQRQVVHDGPARRSRVCDRV